MVAAPRLAPTEAVRRWAALLQKIFEVDPLACPSCHGAMRIVAFITTVFLIDQILAHLRTRASREAHAGPRSPPSTRAPAPVRRRSACQVSTAPTPRHHAGTVGVGGRPTGATDSSPPASLPHGDRRSHGPRGARTRQRARRRPPVSAHAVGDHVVNSTDPNRNSYPNGATDVTSDKLGLRRSPSGSYRKPSKRNCSTSSRPLSRKLPGAVAVRGTTTR